MQIRIDQITRFSWTDPAPGVIKYMRLTPYASDRQQVVQWRIDVDADGRMTTARDVFGNLCHLFYAERPVESVQIEVSGIVHTVDSSGVLTGNDDPLPTTIYRRSTPLTAITPAIAIFADGFRRPDPLETLHELMGGIHSRMRLTTDLADSISDADSALSEGQGRCVDFAQVFIAAARHLGFPARFVSGHLALPDRDDTSHNWAQACVEGLGWVNFDAALDVSISEAHVEVAIGLDCRDAIPVRSARRGGGTESLAVGARGPESIRQHEMQRQA